MDLCPYPLIGGLTWACSLVHHLLLHVSILGWLGARLIEELMAAVAGAAACICISFPYDC